MGTGGSRISKLGDIPFQGRVGANVVQYSRDLQKLCHDLVEQLDDDIERAQKRMRELDGLPLLFGLDLRLRARSATRPLRKAREHILAVSAESVKFAGQYHRSFVEDSKKARSASKRREVSL